MTVLSPTAAVSNIGTFSGLKAAVANWMHRSDLTSVIPDFVALCEANIRRDVRCRAMEQSVTGTLTAAELDLPDRFAEAIRISVSGSLYTFVTPSEFKRREDCTEYLYTILDEHIVFQATSGDYLIEYYEWFAPLSEESDSNWLLENYPDIYLYGTLAEAMLYVAGDPTRFATLYERALGRIVRSEQKYRFSGQLTVRPPAYY